MFLYVNFNYLIVQYAHLSLTATTEDVHHQVTTIVSTVSMRLKIGVPGGDIQGILMAR